MRTFVRKLGIVCPLSVSAAGTALTADPHTGAAGQPTPELPGAAGPNRATHLGLLADHLRPPPAPRR